MHIRGETMFIKMQGALYRRCLITFVIFLFISCYTSCNAKYTIIDQNTVTEQSVIYSEDDAEILQSGDEIIHLTTDSVYNGKDEVTKKVNRDEYIDLNPIFSDDLIANVVDKDVKQWKNSAASKDDIISLGQNSDDYYMSVDIEFENLSNDDNNVNSEATNIQTDPQVIENNTSREHQTGNDVGDNPLNVETGRNYQTVPDNSRDKRNIKSKELSDDDIEQEIYEELVETYDDEDDENTEDYKKAAKNDDATIVSNNESGEKFYRDTFMDRIIEDMKVKRPKNVAKREKRDLKYLHNRDRELTGDTVLHLRSEISDVIKSETDLKSSLLSDKVFAKENVKSDSYVDNIMIHPSEFIQDTTPFESSATRVNKDEKTKETISRDNNKTKHAKDKNYIQNEKKTLSTNPDMQNDWMDNQDLNNEAFEDNTTTHNDSDVILAVLDSRKLLRCHLKVADVKQIVWLKDGERIPVSGLAGSAYEVTAKGDIIIKRVGREHQGKWRCEEQGVNDNTLRLVDKERDLLVMESPSAPYLEVFGRRLDPGNVFLPAREGTELVMACHVERGSPTPSLHWETSKPMHMTHQYTQGSQITSSIAAVIVRRSHHNTTISCVCKHPALEVPMVASTLLHVQYAPRFGISRTPGFGFPLEEGSAVSLRCEVDSNPPATPTWRKDEKEPPVEQTDDGYLNFTSVRREHSGWYKCSATHPLGNFSSIGYFLNVRYEVESATEQQVYHQTAGRSEEHLAGGVVQLQCPPGSVGCWSPPTPPSAAPVGLIRQDSQGGSYVCSGLSANEASRLHAMLGELNVFNGGAPVVYPSNASLTVKEESSVTLEGEFCVETGLPPPKVLWLGQGRALRLPDNYNRITTHHSTPTNSTASVQCNVAKLSINKCTPSDSGEYSLVVRGRRGIGEAIFHVHVLERDKHTLLEQTYNAGMCGTLDNLMFAVLIVSLCLMLNAK